jgi:hypothetical protein
LCVESSWNVMAHGDERGRGEWKESWGMNWVASTLHTTSEYVVSSITTADEHKSTANSRLNWHSSPIKYTCPFRRKTRSGSSACAITFQVHSTYGRASNYIAHWRTSVRFPTTGAHVGTHIYRGNYFVLETSAVRNYLSQIFCLNTAAAFRVQATDCRLALHFIIQYWSKYFRN